VVGGGGARLLSGADGRTVGLVLRWGEDLGSCMLEVVWVGVVWGSVCSVMWPVRRTVAVTGGGESVSVCCGLGSRMRSRSVGCLVFGVWAGLGVGGGSRGARQFGRGETRIRRVNVSLG